ncbi:hypothetical protein DICPUDRAFT_152042 [Dictyostelium purpureum]|uniref:Uncharacterized protein n=1 Tax=Dictyostelium purpureum TaxID=5786 RepID=F0ZKB8_DICPU|nr:uncharacterized protein DICPUDRAFT_152042 [Dictyostelium purpureum]EGC35617.1 hypothetical protein DICPUDRAFT_152042 [Dictyostelium purpureum]|eukprot:XP_003287854.1 hypothetical protein DICPUDRAFT_152042 [Dictyostelium purpureum]
MSNLLNNANNTNNNNNINNNNINVSNNNSNYSNSNDIDKLISSSIFGQISINLVISWLSSTKTNKYNSYNDSHYSVFLETQNNEISNLSNNNENNSSVFASQVLQSQNKQQPTINQTTPQQKQSAPNDFPPLAAQGKKAQNNKNNNETKADSLGYRFPNISKTITKASVDNTVEIYSTILYNRLYPTTLSTELTWIIKYLTTLQINIFKLSNFSINKPKNNNSDNNNLDNQLFESIEWAIAFIVKLIKNIKPLFQVLEPKFLQSLSENHLLKHYDVELCKSLNDISYYQIQENTLNSHKDKGTSTMKIASPFRTEMDFQKKLRKSEDAGILSNREKSLDQFYEIMRNFQLDYKFHNSSNNQLHGNSDQFEYKTKEFFNLLHRGNIWWFCDLFIDQFIQCKFNDYSNTSNPTPNSTNTNNNSSNNSVSIAPNKTPSLAEAIALTLTPLNPKSVNSSTFTPSTTTQPAALVPSDKMALLQKRFDQVSPHKSTSAAAIIASNNGIQIQSNQQPSHQHQNNQHQHQQTQYTGNHHHHNSHLNNHTNQSSNKENLVNQQFTPNSQLKNNKSNNSSSNTKSLSSQQQQQQQQQQQTPSQQQQHNENLPIYMNKLVQQLILKFSNKERFFINMIINYDNNTFHHHLSSSIIEKMQVLQTCQCSNSNHYHSDFFERILNLKSLSRLLSFIYFIPTATYTSYNMSLLIPNFNEIAKRSQFIPPPIDLKSLLFSGIQHENLSIILPIVLEFLKLRDTVGRENHYFSEAINILKNIYNLPMLLATPIQPNYSFSSLFILFELEQFFEELSINSHQFNHVALPFKVQSNNAGSLLSPTSPTKQLNNSNNTSTPSQTPPTTPTKQNSSSTPTTPSKNSSNTTPKKTPSNNNNSTNNNSSNNSIPLIDNNSKVGFNLLWSNTTGYYSSNNYGFNEIKLLLNEPIHYQVEFQKQLKLKQEQYEKEQQAKKEQQEKGTLASDSDKPTTISSSAPPTKTLIPRRITPMNKKTTTTIISNNIDEMFNESPLQHQLEWWYFWNHPSIARISNLLSETLLPFFSEMIFNLSVPIIVGHSNSYIEKSLSGASLLQAAVHSESSSTPNQIATSNLLDSNRLQSLITLIYNEVRTNASKKVESYCKENIKTLILLLSPMGIDETVLNVGTSIICRHLKKMAENICLVQILQKVEILCIEIITRKQTINAANRTSTLQQLLSLSLSDINRNNSQSLSLAGIKSHHIAKIEENFNVRIICKSMEEIQIRLEPFINDIFNVQQQYSNEQQQQQLAKLKNDIQISAESIFVKISDYIKQVASDQNFEMVELSKALPSLFRLVIDIITNNIILNNFYQYSNSIIDEISKDKPNSNDKDDKDEQNKSKTNSTSLADNIIFNVDLNPATKFNDSIVLPINQNISTTFTQTTLEIIKRFNEVQHDFMELLTNYLLQPSKIFSLINQTIQYIKITQQKKRELKEELEKDPELENDLNYIGKANIGNSISEEQLKKDQEILTNKIQNCFDWLHSFDWLCLTLIQENVITIVSLESSWINLFDRCITFIFEYDVELQKQLLRSQPQITTNSHNNHPTLTPQQSQQHLNHLLIGSSVLRSFLKYICQFVSFYHNYFTNFAPKSTTNTAVASPSPAVGTTPTPTVSKQHQHDPMSFFLCIDSFLQRLIKFKSREKFRYNQTFIDQIDKCILYLEKSINVLFPTFK